MGASKNIGESLLKIVWGRGIRTRSRLIKTFCVLILGLDILLQPWFATPRFGVEEIGHYRDLGGKFQVLGEVTGEPDVRSDAQNLVVSVIQLSMVTGAVVPVTGKMMVKAQRYPEYRYGEILQISCKLQTPPVFEKFSYAAFLAKDDIFVLCGQPGIRRINNAPSVEWSVGGFFDGARRGFWSNVFMLKGWMIARVNELYSEPAASLVAGILIGARRAIPQSVLDDFNAAGLTHVLAISGYNVSMMIAVFGFFCKGAARRWRYVGMFAGVLALVALTGFSASVLRAAWMGCITLFAQAFGRKGSAVHLLLVSGVIMVCLSPRMILVDLSFQLSFLSTLGILLFMPRIERFEEKFLKGSCRWPFACYKKIPAFMREGFWVTMAAQVFTTPLLLFQFGRFSLIAPIANIFVLPFVPWLMLFSFCGLVLSFLFFPLGQLLSFIAHVIVMVMLFLVNVFASLPFASFYLS